MNIQRGLGYFVVACLAAVAIQTAGAQTTKHTTPKQQKPKTTYQHSNPQHTTAQQSTAHQNVQQQPTISTEKVTLDIRGAECSACAKVLTTELSNHGIHAQVSASTNKPFRMETEIAPMMDLGACGKAIMDAKTPDRAKVAPELDLVLFSKLDKVSAAKATDALKKMQGIDAARSKVNAENGEITIALKGGAKVTANEIRKALQDAGIMANFTKSMTVAKR